jgi:hypothetical protein
VSASDADGTSGSSACVSAVCNPTDMCRSGMEDGPGVDWMSSVANQKVVFFTEFF